MKPHRTRRLILIIFFLNIADAILTWISVSAGMAYEANPVIARLLSWNAPAFFCIKIGLVSLALLLAYKRIKIDSPRYIYTFSIIVGIMFVIVFLGLTATIAVFL